MAIIPIVDTLILLNITFEGGFRNNTKANEVKERIMRGESELLSYLSSNFEDQSTKMAGI